MANFDRIDLQMLAILQEHGRVSQYDLARAVGLSAPAVGERLRKLEERGAIQQYTALLDPAQLGQMILSFVTVAITGSRHFADFRARVLGTPEILECYSVTGQGSHLLKIRVPSTGALEELLAEIQAWPGVNGTTTSVAMSTLKETTALPLPVVPEAAGGVVTEEEVATGTLLHVPFRQHPDSRT